MKRNSILSNTVSIAVVQVNIRQQLICLIFSERLNMARKAIQTDQVVKLIVGAGQASPSPPVGPALGSKGVKSMDFCKVIFLTLVLPTVFDSYLGIQRPHSTRDTRYTHTSSCYSPPRSLIPLRTTYSNYIIPASTSCECQRTKRQAPRGHGARQGKHRGGIAETCL